MSPVSKLNTMQTFSRSKRRQEISLLRQGFEWSAPLIKLLGLLLLLLGSFKAAPTLLLALQNQTADTRVFFFSMLLA